MPPAPAPSNSRCSNGIMSILAPTEADRMALDTFCNEKTRCAVYGETFCEITQLPLIHCVFCLKKRTAISVVRTILGEGGRVGLRTPLIDAVDRKSSTFAPKYAKKGDQTELEWEKHGDTGPNYGKNYKGKEFNKWVVQGARTDLERGVMGAEDADVWVVAMVPTVEEKAEEKSAGGAAAAKTAAEAEEAEAAEAARARAVAALMEMAMPAVEVEESEESEADEAEGEESEESEGGDGGEDGDGGDVDDGDGAEDGDGGEGGGGEKGGGEGGGGEGDGGGRVGWRKSRRKRGLPPAMAVVPPCQRTAKEPTMPYSGGDGVCPICSEGEDKLLRLPCNHISCAECLCKWKTTHRKIQGCLKELSCGTRTTCPMCRALV